MHVAQEGYAPLQLAEHKKHKEIIDVLKRAIAGQPLPDISEPSLPPLPTADSADPIVLIDATGSPMSWAPGSVQAWLKTLPLNEKALESIVRPMFAMILTEPSTI